MYFSLLIFIARMQQDREHQARRLRLFREHEEIVATRPVQMIVENWSLNISRFHRITVIESLVFKEQQSLNITLSSMIELHHKPKWSLSSIYTSQPNIYEECRLKNKVAFLVNGGVVSRIYPRYNFSIDEKDDIYEDNMDNICVVCEMVEKRDQALCDVARGTSITKFIRIPPTVDHHV